MTTTRNRNFRQAVENAIRESLVDLTTDPTEGLDVEQMAEAVGLTRADMPRILTKGAKCQAGALMVAASQRALISTAKAHHKNRDVRPKNADSYGSNLLSTGSIGA